MHILLEYSEMEQISKWISNTLRNEGWIFKRMFKFWMIFFNIQRDLKCREYSFKYSLNIYCHFKWRWTYRTLVIQATHEYLFEYSRGSDPQMLGRRREAQIFLLRPNLNIWGSDPSDIVDIIDIYQRLDIYDEK